MDKQNTIYLNHAGTSWPKPESVIKAAMSVFDGDATNWANLLQTAHQVVADFFHVDSSRLLLTPSCTAALSLAISDNDWKSGDRVVSSHFEHHALHRALVKLDEQGVDVKTLPRDKDELIDLAVLESELRSGRVKMVALTAACNVTGQLLPIADAIDLAHRYDALVLIDGAQIAGWWDLNVQELGADLFTFAGHKGLQAPWGIGGLYVSPEVSMSSPLATCERTDPAVVECTTMPGYCDAGSVNLSSLVGLAAACNWLSHPDRKDRLKKARELASDFADAIRDLPGVVIHHDVPFKTKVPTVAITMADYSAAEMARCLRENGLITSGGFQCAPQAHMALGTSENGVIRFSFGPTNHESEAAVAVDLLKKKASVN